MFSVVIGSDEQWAVVQISKNMMNTNFVTCFIDFNFSIDLTLAQLCEAGEAKVRISKEKNKNKEEMVKWLGKKDFNMAGTCKHNIYIVDPEQEYSMLVI